MSVNSFKSRNGKVYGCVGTFNTRWQVFFWKKFRNISREKENAYTLRCPIHFETLSVDICNFWSNSKMSLAYILLRMGSTIKLCKTSD